MGWLQNGAALVIHCPVSLEAALPGPLCQYVRADQSTTAQCAGEKSWQLLWRQRGWILAPTLLFTVQVTLGKSFLRISCAPGGQWGPYC